MEGALRGGDHDRAVHRVRRLRRDLPARRHRLRARRGQVQALPPRGGAWARQLHPRREGLHHLHTGVPAVPGVGAGRRQAPVRPRRASPTRCTASGKELLPVPGQRRDGPQDGPGRRVRVGDAHLAARSTTTSTPPSGQFLAKDDADGQRWKAEAGRGTQQGGDPRLRREPLHVLRQHPGLEAGQGGGARSELALVGMGCQTSSPPIMWDRKAGKVGKPVPVQHRAALLEDVRRLRSSPSSSRPSTA